MQKLYYSIREVSEMLDEEQHILRYWEKEFKTLKPKKNSAGNRKYNAKDIELLKKIKELLRDSEMNLLTAREIIDNNKKLNNLNIIDGKIKSVDKDTSISVDKNLIKETIKFLKDLSANLKQL